MDDTSDDDSAAIPDASPRIITIVCATLLVAHVSLRLYYGTLKEGLDAVALGLTVMGLSPWIAAIIKSLRFGGVEVTFQEVQRQVKEQGLELRHTRFLLAQLIPEWEVRHLMKFDAREPFVMDDPAIQGQLQHLFYMGFIRSRAHPEQRTGFLDKVPLDADVHEYCEITTTGRKYLKISREARDMISAPDVGAK